MSFPLVNLESVCEVIAGQSPPSNTYNDNKIGLPFFQGKADYGQLYPVTRMWCSEPLKISLPNDILLSVRAPVGPTNLNNSKACIGRGLSAIRCTNRIETKFLLHFLRFNEQKIADKGTGSTFKAITQKDIKALEIPLPPLAEQQKIAAILDAADSLRQKDQQLVERYTALSQSLFLEMFGDPVTNPRGWEKGTIRDLISSANYGTSAKAEENGMYPYLRMNNITFEGYMDFTSLKYINLDEKDKAKYLARKGDVLFNRTNSKELVGKTAIYNQETEMAIAGYLIRLRVSERANPYFIWGCLNSKHGKATLAHMCKSIVGMANINAQELQNIECLLPPVSLQNQFAEHIYLIEAQKQQAQRSLEKSEALFNSLLQRAFTGELTVKMAA